ncbi:MAG: hypothetical protein OXU81_06620 [Gammaproteobacteria bacterium]|nr:hypothetical protein [Gammaproteobacteria bacterium]
MSSASHRREAARDIFNLIFFAFSWLYVVYWIGRPDATKDIDGCAPTTDIDGCAILENVPLLEVVKCVSGSEQISLKIIPVVVFIIIAMYSIRVYININNFSAEPPSGDLRIERIYVTLITLHLLAMGAILIIIETSPANYIAYILLFHSLLLVLYWVVRIVQWLRRDAAIHSSSRGQTIYTVVSDALSFLMPFVIFVTLAYPEDVRNIDEITKVVSTIVIACLACQATVKESWEYVKKAYTRASR